MPNLQKSKSDLIEDINLLQSQINNLKEFKARFGKVLNSVPIGIYYNDLKGNLLYGNKKAEEIIGYKSKELVGKNLLKLSIIRGEDKLKAAKLLALNKLGKSTGPDYFTLYRKDNTVRKTKIFSQIIRMENKKVVLGIIKDITETEKALTEFNESEKRYKAVVEQSRECIFLIDLESLQFIESNKYFKSLLGYSEKDLSKMTLYDLLAHEEKDVNGKIRTIVRKKGHYLGERVYRKKDGSTLPVEASVSLIEYVEKKVMCVVANDISERKKKELELKESEEKFRTLFSSSPDALIIISAEGICEDGNDAAVQLIGLKNKEEGIGKLHLSYVHPDDQQFIIERFRSVLTKPKSKRKSIIEYRVIKKDGSVINVCSSSQKLYQGKGLPPKVLLSVRDITESKSMQIALKENEEKLRNIVENATNMFYSHTDKHKITYISPQSRDFLQCEPEDAMISWTEFATDHPNNLKGIEITEKTIKTGKKQPSYELELIGKKGKIIQVEVNEAPVLRNGKTIGIVGSLTDITLRKQNEKSIKKRLDYEKLLSEISSLAIRVDNLDNFQKKCLKILAKTLNVSRIYIFEYNIIRNTITNTYEWVGNGISPEKANLQNIPIREFPGWIENIKKNKIFNYKNIEDIPTEKDRELLKIQNIKSILIVPIFVSNKFYGFMGFDECRVNREWSKADEMILHSVSRIISGVIERKIAEEALKVSENRLHSLLQNIEAAVVVHGPDTKIVKCNKLATELLGLSVDQLLGKKAIDPVWRFVNEDGNDMVVEDYPANQVLKTSKELKNFVAGIYRPITKDIKYVLVNAVPDFDQDNNISQVIVTFMDITMWKEADAEKESLQNQLKQSQKMESIATLAGGIAHEFNNALTPVLGNIELLNMNIPANENVDEYITPIKESVSHMSKLTNQLLAYSKGGKYKPKNIVVNKFIEDSIVLLRHSIDARKKIIVDSGDSIYHISADKTQLQMILTAIIKNAAEAIKNKGTIRISVVKSKLDEQFKNLHQDCETDSYICVCLEDNGCGMDEKTKERIFEPFYSTKFQGRGLGLASVYGIVKNHNGFISVDSVLEKGTIVKIFFPELIKDTQPKSETKTESFRQSATILIIEDEEFVLKVNERMLEQLGHRTLLAKNAEEALNVVNTFEGQIDLVLMDMGLPDMPGEVLFFHLKEIKPDIKIIICSGYAVDGPAQKALNAGALDFLQKPYSFGSLAQILTKHLH